MNHTLQRKRAAAAWKVLAKRANKGDSPLTYGQLCSQLGGLNPRVAQWFLGKIQNYCDKHALPPLQALVVNANTRLPGPGYVGSARTPVEHNRALQRVNRHHWPLVPPYMP